MNQKYAFAINNVLIFIFTGLLTTILHEMAHFFAALSFGFSPELHHNYVSYDDANISTFQQMIIAGAGPVFSLILGAICLYFAKKATEKGLFSLTLLWMGLHGTLCFVGYMMIAPFFTYGDTGKVLSLLGVPQFIVIALSILSIIILTTFYRKQAIEFNYYAESDTQIKKEQANHLFLLPIVIGGVFTALMHYPFPGLLSFLAPVMMPFTFFSTYGGFRRTEFATKPTVFINQYSTVIIVLTALIVLIFRLLVYGFKI
jgi:hypothetical protein